MRTRTLIIELTDCQTELLKPLIDEIKKLNKDGESFAIFGQIELFGSLNVVTDSEIRVRVYSGDDLNRLSETIQQIERRRQE